VDGVDDARSSLTLRPEAGMSEVLASQIAAATFTALSGSSGACEEHLDRAAVALADPGCQGLVLDLSEVTSVSETTALALLGVVRLARQRQVPRAFVVGENREMRRLVEQWTLQDSFSPAEQLPELLLTAADGSSRDGAGASTR
jgi:anti-anti-sigma regulatory factor